MNDRDIAALKNYDPSHGDFLVLKGKGDDEHIERRHLRGASIPFLGRILQKIFYPSFRFMKVVDYIFNDENSMQGVKEKYRTRLQGAINGYFKLTPYGQALKHDKEWERVQERYAALFLEAHESEQEASVEIEAPQKPQPPSIEIATSSLGLDLYLDSVTQLPASLLSELPRNRNYFLINLMNSILTEEEIDTLPEREINRMIEQLESIDQPIILLVSDHTGSWGCQQMPVRIQKRLDTLPPMTYCPLYYDFLNFQQTDSQSGWEPTEEANLESIRLLNEQPETE
ncbi:MAG: hypothetical protein ACK5MA_08700 [Parachlamydiaceae bacterium]